MPERSGWAWLVVTACALGCGHASAIRPTPKGVLQLEADLGGPIASWGFPFPMPHGTAGVSLGLTDHLDVSTHVHLTPLAAGVVGLDVGSTFLLLPEQRPLPALAATGRLYGFTDLHGAAAYAEGSVTASYLLADRLLPYLSMTVLAQFAGGPPILSPSAGALVWFDTLGLQLEARWFQPGLATGNAAVPWVGIAGQGALGLTLGLRWRPELGT